MIKRTKTLRDCICDGTLHLHSKRGKVAVACSQCGYMTRYHDTRQKAMDEWNKMIRDIKRLLY